MLHVTEPRLEALELLGLLFPLLGKAPVHGIQRTDGFDLVTGIREALLCEKGGVENGIKMIRALIPKGVDLAPYSDDDVKRVIEILNSKPRKSLGYAMPKEIMAKQLSKNKKIPSRGMHFGGEFRIHYVFLLYHKLISYFNNHCMIAAAHFERGKV